MRHFIAHAVDPVNLPGRETVKDVSFRANRNILQCGGRTFPAETKAAQVLESTGPKGVCAPSLVLQYCCTGGGLLKIDSSLLQH